MNRKIKGNIFLCIALVLISVSSYYLYNWYQDSKITKELTNELIDTLMKEINNTLPSFLYNPPSDLNDIYYSYIAEPFLEVDFNNLKAANNDTALWLKVEGTSINTAVLQTIDNDYYLNHSFDKKINKAGWLFLDYRNTLDIDKNMIIYGHRRLDDTMFGPLINVLNDKWLNNKDNHIIKISSLKYNLIYEVISVYTIQKESYYIKTYFSSDDAYLEFLKTIKKRSIYDFNTSLDINDRILTLSTCLDNFGKRLVVHAKLIKKETR